MESKAFALVAAWSILLGATLHAHARTQVSSSSPSPQSETTTNPLTVGQSPAGTSAPDTSSGTLDKVIAVVVSEVSAKIDRNDKSDEETRKLVIQAVLADMRVLSAIQRSLLELGYAPGPANGQMTPETRSAISQFLVLNGLVASGDVSADLVNRLLMRCQISVVNLKTTPVGACPKPKESGVPGIGVIEIR